MNLVPDVLGMSVDEAVTHLRQAGWEAEVRVTLPYRGKPQGPQRVIRCRKRDATKVEVVVAHQGWEEVGAADSVQDHR